MEAGHTTSEWLTVATVSRFHDAHLLKAMLEGEGIPVFLKDAVTAQTYTNPLGGIKVQVPSPEADKAARLIEESGYQF